jgi:hypothetical protein
VDAQASPAQPEAEVVHVLEEGRRLSESLLWRLQRDLYDAQGITAWSRGGVPQALTTSPHIARAYAHVTLGYLRDLAAELDPGEPVYIVELGAGSGRFGFRFVKQLTRLLARSSLRHVQFTYVMTDVSPDLIEFWQKHPSLRPLVASGRLDFARFDVLQPGDLSLVNSGTTLRAGEMANPIVVVANYFFDSVPHDSFSIQDKQLHENLVRVCSDREDFVLGSERSLTDLQVSFEARPVSTDYYPDSILNRLLAQYEQSLDNIVFLLPVAGITSLRYFAEVAKDRALFLVGDIGSTRAADLVDYTSGGIGADNNFWLSVNFHALGEYVAALGGTVLHPPHRHAHLNISTLALGDPAGAEGEMGLAYEETVAHLGPDDFFQLSTVIAGRLESMHRGELLAFLRSSGWDTEFFLQCLPYLLDSLQEVSWSGKEDVRRAVEEAWDVYYPIGDSSDAADLPSGFGVLLYTIGDYARAMEYFQHSLEFVRMDARTTFNVALCLHRLGRLEEAAVWIDRTLELDPNVEQAQALRETL